MGTEVFKADISKKPAPGDQGSAPCPPPRPGGEATPHGEAEKKIHCARSQPGAAFPPVCGRAPSPHLEPPPQPSEVVPSPGRAPLQQGPQAPWGHRRRGGGKGKMSAVLWHPTLRGGERVGLGAPGSHEQSSQPGPPPCIGDHLPSLPQFPHHKGDHDGHCPGDPPLISRRLTPCCHR